MKKLFLFLMIGFVVSLTSCKKPTTENGFEKHLKGTWEITEMKLSHMSDWQAWPATEDATVTITDHQVDGGWFTLNHYDVIDKGVINLYNTNGNCSTPEIVSVELYKKSDMHWRDGQGNEMKFKFISK